MSEWDKCQILYYENELERIKKEYMKKKKEIKDKIKELKEKA